MNKWFSRYLFCFLVFFMGCNQNNQPSMEKPPGADHDGQAFTFQEVGDGIYHIKGTGVLSVGCNSTLIVNERERMLSMLAGLKLVKPLPSQANFILCQLPDGRGRHVYEGLARHGIFVRHFDHPRLLDYVRISVGLPHETEALTVCMKDVLDE